MNDISAIETVIEPTRGLRWIRWRELYAYRDLFWLLVWREIASRYKQTVLGLFWWVVQPIMTTVVFMVVFNRVAHIPTDGVPSSLFYFCGLLSWNYFSQTFQSTSGSLINNSGIFGKVYFPRLIVPLSTVVSNLVPFVIQLATFFVLYCLQKESPRADTFGITASVWLLPLAVAQVGLLSLGVGLWVAALGAKFRDFAILAGFIVQLWMYATPVVYPLSLVHQRFYWVAKLNPLTFPVEAIRQMLLGAGSPTLHLFEASIAITLAVFAGGIVVFRRVEKTFVDII